MRHFIPSCRNYNCCSFRMFSGFALAKLFIFVNDLATFILIFVVFFFIIITSPVEVFIFFIFPLPIFTIFLSTFECEFVIFSINLLFSIAIFFHVLFIFLAIVEPITFLSALYFSSRQHYSSALRQD